MQAIKGDRADRVEHFQNLLLLRRMMKPWSGAPYRNSQFGRDCPARACSFRPLQSARLLQHLSLQPAKAEVTRIPALSRLAKAARGSYRQWVGVLAAGHDASGNMA
jgi:hypothetical protein